MQEFIQMAVKQLGISEGTAQNATGGLLGLIQKNVPGGDFSKLMGALPGAQDLLSKFGGGGSAPASGGGGGLLGGMLGKAAAMVGGDLGKGLSLASIVQGSGLSMDKAGGFVSLFMNFVKSKAGDGTVQGLLGKLPDLAKLVK